MSEDEDTGSPRLSGIENEVDNLRDHVSNLITKVEKKRSNLQTFVSLIRTEDKAYEEISPKLLEVNNDLSESGRAKVEFENFKTKLEERQKDVAEKLARLEVLLEQIVDEEPKVKDFAVKVHELYQDANNEGKEAELENLRKENDEWWNEIRERFKESKKLRISLLKGKEEDFVQEFKSWKKASSFISEANKKTSKFEEDLKTQRQKNESLQDKVASLQTRAAEADKYSDEIKNLLTKVENEEREKTNLEKHIDSYKQLLEDSKKLVDKLEQRNDSLNEDIAEENKRSADLRSEINALENQLDQEKEINRDRKAEIEKLQELLDKEKDESDRWLREVEVLQGKVTKEEAYNEEIAALREDLEEKEGKIEELRKELDQKHDSQRDTERVLAEKERELEDTTEKLQRSEDALQSEKIIKDEYEIKCEMLEHKIDFAESENKEIRNAAAIKENFLKQERERVKELEEDIETQKEENKILKDKVSSLEIQAVQLEECRKEIKKLSNNIESEEKEKLSLEKNIANYKQMLENSKQLVTKLELRNDTLSEDIVEENRKSTELKSEIAELEHQLDEEREINRDRKVEIQKLQGDVDREKDENERCSREIEELQNKITKEEEYNKEILEDNDSLKEKVSSLEVRATELEERKKEIKELLTKVENEEKEKNNLEKHIDSYKQLLEDSKKLVDKLDQRNDSLSKDIAEENKRSADLRSEINELENQLDQEKEINRDRKAEIEKLQELLDKEKDESDRWLREVEVLQGKVTKEEAYNKEMAALREDLEEKEGKLEELRKELDQKYDSQRDTERALAEKERELEDTAEKLQRSKDALQSEKLLKDEYEIKCEMLEHKVDLAESENKKITNAAEIQEALLKEEKERVKELQEEIKEAKRKNEDLQCEITELNQQLSAAEAFDQYNQAIKSQSLESLKSAEEENEQLLEVIEDLKENVSDKEMGIQEMVERYAIEEQKLKNDISNLTRELQIFTNDCITKSQIIDDLRDELDNRFPTQGSNSAMVELDALRDRNKEIGARVASLETELIKERERNEKFEETILELNSRYDEAEEKYETFDREASEELDRKDEKIEELARKLEEEQERNEQIELQLENLREIGKISKELSDSKGVDASEVELLTNRMKTMKEEFERNEIRRRDERIAELEEELERMNDQLRDEQCEAAEKDGIISDFKETSLKDRQKITEYAEELKDMKEQLRVKKLHIEELTEKVLESQILVMDLQSEAESERSRAATIEELLTAEKGRYFHQITIVHDLKKKVEEYQSTVGEIKSKVDRINRHLRCLPQGALDGSKSVSTEDLSARKVSQKLTSQRLSLKDIKATVSTVEDKHEQLMQEVKEETTKNADQDLRIEELIHKTSEYDTIMDEMREELDNIKGRYENICQRLQFQDEIDSSDWEREQENTTASVLELRRQLSQFEHTFETIFKEEARRIDEVKEKLGSVMAKSFGFVRNLKGIKIKRYEIIVDGMAKELEEERKLNADLTERVIRELEDTFKENQERLKEISRKAEEDERRSLEMTEKFSTEKNEKENRIQELVVIMNQNKEVLNELKLNLEKEQESVFELTEELTNERSTVSEKNSLIEDLKEHLAEEKKENKSLKSALEEEGERALQLSAVLTVEQVKGVEREDKIKTAEEFISQLEAKVEEKEEKIREMEEELEDTKHQANQLTKLVEDEVVLCTQMKESLIIEQRVKTGYEKEIEELMDSSSNLQQLNEELRNELEQQKSLLHDVEDKMKEMEQEHLHREALIEALKTALEAEGQNYSVLAARLEAEETRKTELELKLQATEKNMQNEVSTVLETKEREKKEKEDELQALLARLDDEQTRLGELLEGEKQRSYELDATLEEERHKLLDKDNVLSDMFEQLAEEKSRNEELEEMVCQLQKKVSDNKIFVETLIEQNERDSEEKKERNTRTEELELLLEEWKKKFIEQNQEVEMLRFVYQQNEEIKNELQILEREKDKYQQGSEQSEKSLKELQVRCNEQEREIEYGKSRYEQLRVDMDTKEHIMEENNNELIELKRHLSFKEEDIQMATTKVENLKQNLELMKIETEEKAKAVKQKEKILRKAGKKITKDIQTVGTVKRELEQKLAEREIKVQKLEKSVEVLKRLYLATKTELKRLEAAEKARLRRTSKEEGNTDKIEEGEVVMKDVQVKIRELTEEIQYKESAVESLEEEIRETKNIKHIDRKELKRKENLLTVFSSQLNERLKQKARHEKLLHSLQGLYGGEQPQNNDLVSAKDDVDGKSKKSTDSKPSLVTEKSLPTLAEENYQESLIDSNSNIQASEASTFDASAFDGLIKEEESILSELRGSMAEKDRISENIAIVETVSVVESALPTDYGIFQTADGSSDESDIEMGDEDVFEEKPVPKKPTREMPKKAGTSTSEGFTRGPEDRKIPDLASVSSGKKHKRMLLCIVLALLLVVLPNFLSPKLVGVVLAFVVVPTVLFVTKDAEKQQRKAIAKFLSSGEVPLTGSKESEDINEVLKEKLAQKNRENERQQDTIEELKLRIETDTKLIEQIKEQLEEEIAEKGQKSNAAGRSKLDEDSDDLQNIVEMLEKRIRDTEKAKLEEEERNQASMEEYRELRNNIEKMRQERESMTNQEQIKFQELKKAEVYVTADDIPKEYKINLPLFAFPIVVGVALGLFHYTSQVSWLAVQGTFCVIFLFAVNIWLSMKRIKKTLLEERAELKQQNEEIDDILEILDREYDVVKTQKVAIDSLVKELDEEQVNRKAKQKELAKLIWELQEMEGMKMCIPKQPDGGNKDLDLHLKIKKVAEEKALERAQFYSNMIEKLQEIGSEDEEDQVLADELCDAAKELSAHAENTMKDVQKMKETLTEEDNTKQKRRFSFKAVALAVFNSAVLVVSLVYKSKFIFGAVLATEALIFAMVKLKSFQTRESDEILALKRNLEQLKKRNKIQKADNDKLKKLLNTERSYKRSDEFVHVVKERRLQKKITA